MNIKFIICIILGIILYILINKIEGLTCNLPINDVLGVPYNEQQTEVPQLNVTNQNSIPILLKDNVVLAETRNMGEPLILDINSMAPTDDGQYLTLMCNPHRTDIHGGYKLKEDSENTTITCHAPSQKVVYYGFHSMFVNFEDFEQWSSDGINTLPDPTILMRDQRRYGTFIPKKMQFITYVNSEGGCFSRRTLMTYTNNQTLMNIIFNGLYTDIESFTNIGIVYPPNTSGFNVSWSEMEKWNAFYVMYPDSYESYHNFTFLLETFSSDGKRIEYFKTYSDNDYLLDLRHVDAEYQKEKIFGSNVDAAISIYFTKLTGNKFSNVQFGSELYDYLGPYCSSLSQIVFSDNTFLEEQTIEDIVLISDVVAIELEVHEEDGNEFLIYRYYPESINKLKRFIHRYLQDCCVEINREDLSENFKSENTVRLNRLFGVNSSVRLPLFCLDILTLRLFVNPVNNPDYALDGGGYTSKDIVDVVSDICRQIKEKNGNFYQMYINKYKTFGMNKNDTDQYIDNLSFLIFSRDNINYNRDIPNLESFPLIPLLKLWDTWGYSIERLKELNHIYIYTQDIIFLLLQLFKQNNGEQMDIHSFGCILNNNPHTKKLYRNKRMDYSWQYAYSDDELRDPEKRIGPDCEREKCRQSYNDVAMQLSQRKPLFSLVETEEEFNRKGYPSSIKYEYTRNRDNNIKMNPKVENDIPQRVKCTRPDGTDEIQYINCRKNIVGTFNYNISELDETHCKRGNVCGTDLLYV